MSLNLLSFTHKVLDRRFEELTNDKNDMKELIEKYVGKHCTVFVGGMIIEVKVCDVKISYGRERFLITPVAGKGEVWVESVKII